MSFFKISRVQSVESGTSVVAGTSAGQFKNPWGVLIPNSSTTGTIFFDSGSIPANELPVNTPVPGAIRKVVCTAEHIFILG